MDTGKYNVIMFAYNEANNIEKSITSIYNNVDVGLNCFYLLANGCTDNTVSIALKMKEQLKFEALEVIEIKLGDKCNAWNTYIHELSDNVATHFFTDADVQFSENCFSQMHRKLTAAPDETVVIAGLPLSGRNVDFYRSFLFFSSENASFKGDQTTKNLMCISNLEKSSQ